MNTNQENQTQDSVKVKRPGRPIVPTAIRKIRIDENGKPFLRGSPKAGQEYTYVWVHRSITPSNYVHGVSQVVKTEKITPIRKERKPSVKVSNVNVKITEPNDTPTSQPVEIAVNNPLD